MMNNSVPTSPEEWRQYWQAKSFSWRTEPEIDAKRQEKLSKCRAVVPDMEKGIYPFKGMKLNRADVEWLLATHEGGDGPVDWSDESQHEREGLDLQGADLRKADLKGLPLARLNSSSKFDYHVIFSELGRDKAAALHLEGLDLFEARTTIHLEGANLREAHLEEANLRGAHLEMAQLQRSYLVAANLSQAYLQGANLNGTNLQGADLGSAHLEMADLGSAHLREANLPFAHLEKAVLSDVHLEKANLNRAHLEGAILPNANLEGANLQGAFFDSATELEGFRLGNDVFDSRKVNFFGKVVYFATYILGQVVLFWGHQTRHDKHSPVCLADVRWGDAVLAVVKWSLVEMPGEEYKARQKKHDGKVKDKDTQIEEYEDAVRANRQLAVVLQSEGLNEHAARFAYRAKVLERKVFWYQVRGGQVRQLGAYLFSWFLALLTGYGYRMWHIIVAYLILILTFSFAYWGVGVQHTGDISFWQALIVSVTAFHGRVFTNPFTPNVPDAQIAITAIEAVVGLIIEGVFIAMLVQRFFGK